MKQLRVGANQTNVHNSQTPARNILYQHPSLKVE